MMRTVTPSTSRLETTQLVKECRSHQARTPATQMSHAISPRSTPAVAPAAARRMPGRPAVPEASPAPLAPSRSPVTTGGPLAIPNVSYAEIRPGPARRRARMGTSKLSNRARPTRNRPFN
jgi:hypothetical protein